MFVCLQLQKKKKEGEDLECSGRSASFARFPSFLRRRERESEKDDDDGVFSTE